VQKHAVSSEGRDSGSGAGWSMGERVNRVSGQVKESVPAEASHLPQHSSLHLQQFWLAAEEESRQETSKSLQRTGPSAKPKSNVHPGVSKQVPTVGLGSTDPAGLGARGRSVIVAKER